VAVEACDKLVLLCAGRWRVSWWYSLRSWSTRRSATSDTSGRLPRRHASRTVRATNGCRGRRR